MGHYYCSLFSGCLEKSNFVGYYSAQQDINWHYHVHRILKSCNSQKKKKHVGLLEVKWHDPSSRKYNLS